MLLQDKLFVLIKSLTSGEKIYFSKYSRVHHAKEKPDYLRLFEYIDTQEAYDEDAVKKHFKKDKFIKQLPRKKTQLKEKILESLSIFHADRTVETSLRRQMNLLPVLYEKASNYKGLVKEFEKQIKDIKKTAEKHECFSILIELFKWEKLLNKLLDEKGKLELKTFELIENRENHVSLLTHESSLYEQARVISIKDWNLSNSKTKEQIDILLKDLPSDISEIPMSRKAKRYYYFLQSSYHRKEGEIQQAYKCAREMVSVYETLDINSYETAIDYKNTLCNYIQLCREAEKTDDIFDIINKMRASYGNSLENMHSFNTTRFQALFSWIFVYEFEKAIEIADEIEKKWEALCKVISKRRQLAFCYNITVACWLGKDTDKAMLWLSRILNYENTKEGEKFIYLARVIQLPICYDYGDENLHNRVESTRRVLADKNRLFDFEQIVITYFRKLVRCIDSNESEKVISDFYRELISYKKLNQRVNAPIYEAMKLWCEVYT